MKSFSRGAFGAAVLGAALVLGSASVQAQIIPGAEPDLDLPYTEPSQEAIAFSQERGTALFRYDQAAWHSTDAFLEEFDAQVLGEAMRGYVVVPSAQSEGALDAIYYGDFGEGLVEVARFAVRDSEVIGGGFHPADDRPELSEAARKLADARAAVLAAAGQMDLYLCAQAAANSVALPREDGGVDVYILTPLVTMDSIPLGGHYRFTVTPEGEVSQLHRMDDGCPTALLPQITDDTEAVVLSTIVFERAAEPSEIHVFASYFRPVPMFIETPRSDVIWVVEQGVIRLATDDDVTDEVADGVRMISVE